MMQRELFAKVLLAVADCWPIPGRLSFEVSPYREKGCRLVVTDPGKNYTDTIRVSCNFESGSDVRLMVRRLFDDMADPRGSRLLSVRTPRPARAEVAP